MLVSVVKVASASVALSRITVENWLVQVQPASHRRERRPYVWLLKQPSHVSEFRMRVHWPVYAQGKAYSGDMNNSLCLTERKRK